VTHGQLDYIHNTALLRKDNLVRFQVLMAAAVKIATFWDMALSSLVEGD
jgi:hypothetical protein